MMATAPETATAGLTGGPRPLIHIVRFPAVRGLPHPPLSVRIDDPQHVARLEELKDRLAAETAADAALDTGETYLHGRVTWCAGLGMFAATAPVGGLQLFLGYYPCRSMAERIIHMHEMAAGLGPPRRAHRKKPVELVRDREGGNSTS